MGVGIGGNFKIMGEMVQFAMDVGNQIWNFFMWLIGGFT